MVLVGLILSGVPLCPSKNFLGIPCPGCGLTRATEAALAGDFWQMLILHPLAPLITPLAVYTLARTTLVSMGFIDGSSKDLIARLPKPFWATLGIALIGLWLARMAGLMTHPDAFDFSQGWIARGAVYVWELARY